MSEVSTFSAMAALHFWLSPRSSIFPFPFPLLFGSIGGRGGGGPLDFVWYANYAIMHQQTFGNGSIKKKKQQVTKSVK